MDFIDPSDNFLKNKEITGYEPVLGGQLPKKLYGLMRLNVLAVNTAYTSLQILS